MDSTDEDFAVDQGDAPQGEEKEDDCFCTLAVTGSTPTFQAIFVCNEFSEDDAAQSPMCVCQACAEVCRDDGYHEVEYVGMGPSYCDCCTMGNCKLYEKSLREAERLGIIIENNDNEEEEKTRTTSLPENFVREAFDIPMLQNSEIDDQALAPLLVEQAQELIKHTKETFWIDEAVVKSKKRLCLLESLAWSICKSHRERYKDTIFGEDDDYNSRGGAEWWVQVKEISSPSEGEPDSMDLETTHTPLTSSSSSIDLHYDKDEALAESFGIGSFPAISTVTYLTAQPSVAAPTIVFDHTYTQGEDEVMSSMMVSRPRIGKHICFDGRLLHGAPYHPSLLSSSMTTNDTTDSTIDSNMTTNETLFRVTFLVNIWKDRRPASVHVLDDKIRDAILSLPQEEYFLEETPLPMATLEIPKVSYEEDKIIPEAQRDRIELPFVSNLAEEDDNDDDDDQGDDDMGGSTVVVTFPPPQTEDCVLVTFGAGLQAYIDYNYGPEEEEGDVASNAAQADDESFSKPPSQRPNSQSDYV